MNRRRQTSETEEAWKQLLLCSSLIFIRHSHCLYLWSCLCIRNLARGWRLKIRTKSSTTSRAWEMRGWELFFNLFFQLQHYNFFVSIIKLRGKIHVCCPAPRSWFSKNPNPIDWQSIWWDAGKWLCDKSEMRSRWASVQISDKTEWHKKLKRMHNFLEWMRVFRESMQIQKINPIYLTGIRVFSSRGSSSQTKSRRKVKIV